MIHLKNKKRSNDINRNNPKLHHNDNESTVKVLSRVDLSLIVDKKRAHPHSRYWLDVVWKGVQVYRFLPIGAYFFHVIVTRRTWRSRANNIVDGLRVWPHPLHIFDILFSLSNRSASLALPSTLIRWFPTHLVKRGLKKSVEEEETFTWLPALINDFFSAQLKKWSFLFLKK